MFRMSGSDSGGDADFKRPDTTRWIGSEPQKIGFAAEASRTKYDTHRIKALGAVLLSTFRLIKLRAGQGRSL